MNTYDMLEVHWVKPPCSHFTWGFNINDYHLRVVALVAFGICFGHTPLLKEIYLLFGEFHGQTWLLKTLPRSSEPNILPWCQYQDHMHQYLLHTFNTHYRITLLVVLLDYVTYWYPLYLGVWTCGMLLTITYTLTIY